MHPRPSSRQRGLIAVAGRLARERFAPRPDRDASFPFDDYADRRADGLLGLDRWVPILSPATEARDILCPGCEIHDFVALSSRTIHQSR